jgi:hypothetical protein
MPVNSDLDWAIEDVRARARALSLYKDYDEGRHRLLFATEKYRNTFGDLFREFADNMCDDVVDGITDRLQIVGWGAGSDKELNGALDDAWERIKGEARTGAIHRHGFRDGDGFAIVQEAADGLGRVYKQDPRVMAIRYSTEDPDEKELVGKVWKARGRYRVTLYYPDRIEKYASRGVGAGGDLPKAAAFQLLAPGDPALKDDEDATTEVEGIPVYHFPNGELSAYGRSLLENVIPLQDALNKTVADMLVNNEFTAYPQRHASGIQVERDEVTGLEKDPFVKSGPGTIIRTGNKDAKFGQFDASSPEGFLAVIDSFRLEIARKGYLPPHTIQMRSGSSTPPSGIALLVAEGRTIKVAKDRQRDWGGEHQAMMANVVSIDLNTTVDPADLDLNWAPPETRDMKALLEELVLKVDLGLPERQALIEAGYDADDVDEWLGEAQAQGDAEVVAMSVLQGGRGGVTRNAAMTLNGELGMPAGPIPPGGGQSALAGE